MKKHLLPVFLIFIFASVAVAQPSSSPSKYHGHVFYDNGDKAQNVTVKAVVDNTIRDSQEYSGDIYELVVDRESDENFTEVIFVVDNTDTGRTASFEAFGSQQINFTIPAPETDEEDDSDSTDGSDSGSGGGGGGFAGTNFADEEDNEKPVAGFTWDTPVRPGESVTLDASGSFDPDGNISEYRWSIGATGPSVQTVFDSPSGYPVKMTVEDDDGAEVNVTKKVTVTENKPPVPSFDIIYTGSNILTDVEFNASNSYDPDGNISQYSWSFDEQGITAVSSFQESRNVTLKAVDDEGKTATVTKQLNEPVTDDYENTPISQRVTGEFTSSQTTLVGVIALLFLAVGVYIVRKKGISIQVLRSYER